MLNFNGKLESNKEKLSKFSSTLGLNIIVKADIYLEGEIDIENTEKLLNSVNKLFKKNHKSFKPVLSLRFCMFFLLLKHSSNQISD